MDNDHLVKKYGSPLYVVRKKELELSYHNIVKEFKKYYPKILISYAYKANYLPGICKIFQELGSGAEIVGEFEYDIADFLKINPKKIILNGPYKPRLECALRRGIMVNIDNFQEIQDVKEFSIKNNKNVKIGIRLNFDNNGIRNHFGFHFKSLPILLNKIKNSKIILVGLHLHAGTNISNINIFKNAINLILKSIDFFEKNNINLEYIDIGGGFPSKNVLPLDYSWKNWNPPKIDEIARVISNPLIKHYLKKKKPLLVIEPGRYLVQDSVSLLTSVVAVKNIFGVNSIILDGGINLIQSSRFQSHKLKINKYRNLINTDIYGPTCMSTDILETGVYIPQLKKGDVIEILCCGAYEESLSTQFSFYRPATIMIDRKIKLLRPRERLINIFRNEK